jgi:chromosomal replication initiator protein
MSESRSSHAPGMESDMEEDKQVLRLALAELFPEQALRRWFDPLRVACDSAGQRLVVTWPHRLFGDFVARQDIDRLAQVVCRLYGETWTIDCQNPGAPGRSEAQSSILAPAATGGELLHRPEAAPDQDLHAPFGAAYTLDNYLFNAKNNFPLTVLKETAAGKLACNPLVLYGDTGSGKTHLARALGNALSARYGRDAVFFGNADDPAAMQAPLNAWQDECEALRRLSSYKALIVDNMQRLSLLPRLSEIMPALIDHCLEQGKPFVATTGLAPAEWEQLPKRISARLEQGLIMILHTADMDIRLRYVQQQNRMLRLGLGRSQILVLAQQCTGFRRLIGIMQRLSALRDLLGQDISREDMNRVLSHTADTGSLNAQQVIRLVAARCNMRPEDIVGEKRHPRIAQARQMAMFLCRTLLHSSYPAIGRLFGDRDHSTVIHSIKKMQFLWDTDKDMHTTLTELSLACRQQAR